MTLVEYVIILFLLPDLQGALISLTCHLPFCDVDDHSWVTDVKVTLPIPLAQNDEFVGAFWSTVNLFSISITTWKEAEYFIIKQVYVAYSFGGPRAWYTSILWALVRAPGSITTWHMALWLEHVHKGDITWWNEKLENEKSVLLFCNSPLLQ